MTATACALIDLLAQAHKPLEALMVLRRITEALAVDHLIFTTVVRDDETQSSCRSMQCCHPIWCNEYDRLRQANIDPWLQHARRSTEPIRGNELRREPHHHDFHACASELGFRSTLIVPAPAPVGHARVGMLVLGSERPRRFDAKDYPQVRCLARALAMELHNWWHGKLRDDLLAESRLSAEDLELLRREHMGQGSKQIAHSLQLEPRYVDSRFQRINSRLGVTSRAAAARVAALYGLI